MREGYRNRIISEEERVKKSQRFSGKNNPMFGKKHTKAALMKMSIYQKANVRKGDRCNFYGRVPYHGKGSWYIRKDSSKVWMRSSWEIKFASYLDKNCIEWVYEKESYPIQCSNKNCTYTPDFYLVKDKKYIEIKGWWREDAQVKFNSFVVQYPHINIEIYDGSKLRELEII